MLYVIVALSAALGFWFVWMLMDRFSAGRSHPPPQGGRP